MTDNEGGIFSRLGRMIDSGLSQLERTEVKILSDFETKKAASLLHDAAQVKEGELHRPLFSGELLYKLELAEVKLLSDAETKQANSFLHDVAQMKEKELHHPLFPAGTIHSSVLENHIQGGETVHGAPKTPVTPHLYKTTRLREI